MAPENLFSMFAASVVDGVFQQHESRLKDIDMASRKAEEEVSRRYDSASWLRKTVGVVAGKELAEQPSEEEFRLGLRSGYILCTALNKVQPGAIPKVVVCSGDSLDETALSAYQYFENIRNFLVAAENIGVPVFEASDLEKGGNSARVVDSVLALKSYGEWQQSGGNGTWRYGGNTKPVSSGKFFVRKNSEPFANSLSRTSSVNEKFQDDVYADQNPNVKFTQESTEMASSCSLNSLLHALCSDKKREDPKLVESMLEKLMGLVTPELQHRILSQIEPVKMENSSCPPKRKVLAEVVATHIHTEIESHSTSSCDLQIVVSNENNAHSEDNFQKKSNKDEAKYKHKKLTTAIVERQQNDIQELKHTLHTTKAGLQFLQMKYFEDLSSLGKHLQSVTHAASGYQRVLEENRRLYNQIQDLKGSIRVYCRVRPFLPGQSNCTSTVGHLDDRSITILTPSKYGKEGCKSFTFNKVFGPSAAQDKIFADTQPLIRSVLDGYNVCIFAYGQTGSGKTFTMTGPKYITEQSQGVNYRALSDLFSLSEQRRGIFCYDISVQMIEIYNEQVRDLLTTDGHNRKLEIRNNSQKDLNVPDANLVHVASTSDVIELMNIGQLNRAVCSTALNERSSRSHSCLTVHVQGKEIASGTILRGRMHLVDLAGSERINKSGVTGERLREAQHINKSLSALGDVIGSLAQKNPHVPYRNSKLTQLLQDSLGGQAKTLMFVHISPDTDALGETISTLKFAERVSTVELGAACLNKESSEVKELKGQIALLKVALTSKNGESRNLQNQIPKLGIHKSRVGERSPISSNIQHKAVSPENSKQTHKDLESTEAQNNSMGHKKLNSDPSELLPMANASSTWSNRDHRDAKKDSCYEDWVDDVLANKLESRDDDSSDEWQEESPQLTESFYQSYLSDMRDFTDQQCSSNSISRTESQEFDIQITRSESACTDDSDEFDIATNHSSEVDLLWQFNHHNFSSLADANVPRFKKPQSKITNGPETRTPPVQLHSMLPSSKVPNGSLHTPTRNERRPMETKHQLSNGKTRSRK